MPRGGQLIDSSEAFGKRQNELLSRKFLEMCFSFKNLKK
ncbi:MAG: hypothetical protein ACJAVO_002010 [Parvibaculaceae bacterium]|jgi:hypothetical protein